MRKIFGLLILAVSLVVVSAQATVSTPADLNAQVKSQTSTDVDSDPKACPEC